MNPCIESVAGMGGVLPRDTLIGAVCGGAIEQRFQVAEGSQCVSVMMDLNIEAVTLKVIRLMVFIAFSIGSVIEDAKSYRVKLLEIAIGITVIVGIRFAMADCTWIEIMAGGLIGALSFLLVERLFRGKLGPGDIWFSSYIGFAFGFSAWDLSMVVAAFLGLAWTMVKAVLKRRECQVDIRIPFTPFMFGGAIAVSIIGVIQG
jgi:prepilin signal peptidase PulO-like enzyme (type II secretory pathway)